MSDNIRLVMIMSNKLHLFKKCKFEEYWRFQIKKLKNKILIGESERKRPFRRSRCRWDDDVKMDFETHIGRGELFSTDSVYGPVR
jgi:hypothetical protein